MLIRIYYPHVFSVYLVTLSDTTLEAIRIRETSFSLILRCHVHHLKLLILMGAI